MSPSIKPSPNPLPKGEGNQKRLAEQILDSSTSLMPYFIAAAFTHLTKTRSAAVWQRFSDKLILARFGKHLAPDGATKGFLDGIVARLGLLFEFISISIATLYFFEKIEFFVVFKADPHRARILFDNGLIGRGAVTGKSFRTAFIHIFPGCVQVAARAFGRRRCVAQTLREQIRILGRMRNLFFHELFDFRIGNILGIVAQIVE